MTTIRRARRRTSPSASSSPARWCTCGSTCCCFGCRHAARRCTPSALVPAVLTGEKFLPDRCRRDPALGLGAHFHVHARRLLAPRRQHALPVDFRKQPRRRHGPRPLLPVLCPVRGRGGVRPGAANPGSDMPMVGASGAISGVLGGYLLLFPRARVLLGLPLGFIIVQTRTIPGYLGAGGVVRHATRAGRALASMQSTGESQGGIAFSAHIGGFIAGLALRRIFQKTQRSAVAALLRRCYIPRTLRGPICRARCFGELIGRAV